MDRTLPQLAERFQYEAAPTEVLRALEAAMREDTGHPAAKSALDAIDENTVHTEDEFNALLDVINQFTISNQTHNGEIQYNYTPPTEVTLEEFGVGTRSEKGKFYFYEGGVRLEKRPYGDEFETVGPVDEDNTP